MSVKCSEHFTDTQMGICALEEKPDSWTVFKWVDPGITHGNTIVSVTFLVGDALQAAGMTYGKVQCEQPRAFEAAGVVMTQLLQ